jgi:glycerol-3-phosphate dehydrogenase (NAD(P)+)
MVIESVDNIQVAYQLGKIHNIEMPILNTVYAVLFEGLKPEVAVNELMIRNKKAEF